MRTDEAQGVLHTGTCWCHGCADILGTRRSETTLIGFGQTSPLCLVDQLLTLPQCWCYVCDKPAGDCEAWGDGEGSLIYAICCEESVSELLPLFRNRAGRPLPRARRGRKVELPPRLDAPASSCKAWRQRSRRSRRRRPGRHRRLECGEKEEGRERPDRGGEGCASGAAAAHHGAAGARLCLQRRFGCGGKPSFHTDWGVFVSKLPESAAAVPTLPTLPRHSHGRLPGLPPAVDAAEHARQAVRRPVVLGAAVLRPARAQSSHGTASRG